VRKRINPLPDTLSHAGKDDNEKPGPLTGRGGSLMLNVAAPSGGTNMADDTQQTDAVPAVGENGTPNAVSPERLKADPLAGIPQEQFDGWRFIYENWESGIFHPYVDQYVAVYQRKILGSDTHPWHLLTRVAAENGIDPNHIVIAFID
jgi:hypothetical protein